MYNVAVFENQETGGFSVSCRQVTNTHWKRMEAEEARRGYKMTIVGRNLSETEGKALKKSTTEVLKAIRRKAIRHNWITGTPGT
jgi:hypothetical protein